MPMVLGLGLSTPPLTPITVSYRITTNNDGASLFHSSSYWGGPDGEPFYWQDDQLRLLTQVLRFPSVMVPRGATITDARISVWSVSTWSGFTAGNYNDFGVEQVDNGATITNYSSGNSRRSNVGSVIRWQVPNISANSESQSPNLASIVQPVINRAGWNPGNALVFFGEATQDPSAAKHQPAAQSNGHNAGAQYRPLISITYLGTP